MMFTEFWFKKYVDVLLKYQFIVLYCIEVFFEWSWIVKENVQRIFVAELNVCLQFVIL